MTDQNLTSSELLVLLQAIPQPDCFHIALSGGLDSVVLLHLMSTLRAELTAPLKAIHVNHGLQKESDDWQQFCADLSASLDVPLTVIKIDSTPEAGQSLEAWARERRYEAFQQQLSSNDVLLTAQHKDDQIETFLLQQFRGAGVNGLSAMPFQKALGKGTLARPLLDFSREQILQYAQTNSLDWQEDPSNADTRFERNFLRHTLLPDLKQRWPGIEKTLSRVIENQTESRKLLEEVAETDLKNVMHHKMNALNTEKLARLTLSRQKNLFRYWLQTQSFPMPSHKKLQEVFSSLLNSTADKSPLVTWQACEIRRYKHAVYAMSPMNTELCEKYHWDISQDLKIQESSLHAELQKGGGIKLDRIRNRTLEIRFRQGGEKIKPAGSDCSRELKKLFQEKGVLPWFRDRIPLVFIDNKLTLVPAICIADEFLAKQGEEGVNVVWNSSKPFIAEFD